MYMQLTYVQRNLSSNFVKLEWWPLLLGPKHIANMYFMTTSLLRPNVLVSQVTLLMKFNCTSTHTVVWCLVQEADVYHTTVLLKGKQFILTHS